MGMEDKYRAIEGFLNLTVGQVSVGEGGPASTAGEDVGVLPYAHDFAVTLSVPAGGDFGDSTTRLTQLHEQIQPYTQASHTVVYTSERVSPRTTTTLPAGQGLRHACVYEFKAEVTPERKFAALLDLEETLSNTPGLAHFSCGLDEEEARAANGALGLVVDFDVAEDFDRFFADQARLEAMQALNPLLAFRTCVDFMMAPQELMLGGEGGEMVELRRLRA